MSVCERRSPRIRASMTASFLFVLTVAAVSAPSVLPAQASFDGTFYEAMRWRNIGPFRGGRSVAVSGVVSDPMTYYFGSTGGGLWKTTDAGITWRNVTDGFVETGSVGAVAVAESDPNVVYLGMGEHAVRGVATSQGDGMYRSTDAGRTWTHLGLDRSRAISRIRVHPKDPDLVYVAVQGAPHAPTEERGIYRSRDGGANWERILFVSDRAGASDLAMDMTNPRILYAAFWDHLRRPWVVESGGDGSGIWKSTDGGDTWNDLTEGLPELMGKIGIDVSRADPDRVFAIIEAEDGGLFRSDNGGRSWQHVNSERVIQTRSWYYMEVYADPQDRETVYVLNAPMMRSVDGGRTFTNVEVPHGDNHDLWINPNDSDNLINANDGGANVSFNGAATWSTQQNQPTVQFYRVITDNRFPYWVYGGQQDNSSVAIASAWPGGIDWKAWHPVAGCESAYLAFDPDDPQKIFGGCYQGLIEVWDRATQTTKSVMAYEFLGLGTDPVTQRYRFNWNAPIVASPHDPNTIYHAGNVLFRTRDQGVSWDVISPDLTRDQEERQGAGGGPITNEAAGAENYNTIFYVVESPHEAGTIWVGTDDGLVQLTRNGGESWGNVTPDELGEDLINAIEVSPHHPATAYVAVSGYKYNDYTPIIYKTTNYGQSWQRIVQGIDDEAWVRVVREDPVRRDLLYAGTQTGMYISFNGGQQWDKWQLNLPIVPVTDLTTRNNDLVASTEGRGFWILDDLTPVQQISQEATNATLHVYAPRDAHLVQWGGGGPGGGGTAGANPPSGAQVFYIVDEEPDTEMTVEILNQDGTVIRTYTTEEERAEDDDLSELDAPASGLNRFSWNFRHDALATVPDAFMFGSTSGRMVIPGRYQVRFALEGDTITQPLTVLPDPRRAATREQYIAQDQFLERATSMANDVHHSITAMHEIMEQVEGLVERTEDHAQADPISTTGTAVSERIEAWEHALIQRNQETFQDVINFRNQFNAQVLALIGAVDGSEPPVTQGARDRIGDLESEWQGYRQTMLAILREDVAAFNRLIASLGIPAIVVPGEELIP